MSTNEGGSRELVDVPLSAFRHFRVMANDLYTPKILQCPKDHQRTEATTWSGLAESNISYFIALDADGTMPAALLSGDRNLTTNGVPVGPGLLVLSTNIALGYTKELHPYAGNVVLGDGSVQLMNRASMRAFRASGTTNRLLIP